MVVCGAMITSSTSTQECLLRSLDLSVISVQPMTEGDRVGREESEFLSVSVTVVLSVTVDGMFLEKYRYQAAGLSCVSAFGPLCLSDLW